MTEPTQAQIDEWKQCFQTPPALMRWIEKDILPRYGRARFTLDVCAHPWNAKCPEFIGPPGTLPCAGMVGVDGLTHSWATSQAVWCNAGFGDMERWMAKAKEERDMGVFSVLLSHSIYAEQWVWKVIDEWASESWLLRPRVDFDPDPRYLAYLESRGMKLPGAAFNTMLWVFDPAIDPPCVPGYCLPWPRPKKTRGKGAVARA